MLSEEESPAIERVIDMALIAGNYQALFRHAFVHSFCGGGDFKYGYQLLRQISKKGYHNAVYLWSLVLASHAGCPTHNLESNAFRLWVKSIDGLKVLILNKDKEATNVTTNVVYIEAFQNVRDNAF